jgi:hypothetical protein
MTIETLTSFFGWMAVISIGFMAVATIGIIGMRSFTVGIHQRMFGLSEDAIKLSYFNWLANCKIVILFFIVAPYVALRMI